jgi:heme exporter protein C
MPELKRSLSAPPAPLGTGFVALASLAALAVMAHLYLIFVVAPQEATMGIVQKVFYIHVPSAVVMNVTVGVCALASILFLITSNRRFDAWAVSAGELAVLFAGLVLVTGPIWGRKAWGVWWEWRDVRLTSTAVLFLILIAYLFLRAFGGSGAAKFSAAFAIFAVLDLPLIYFAVKRWGGTHPQVITGRGGGIAPMMKPALYMGFLSFLLVWGVLYWARLRLERNRQRVDELYLQAEEAGVEV